MAPLVLLLGLGISQAPPAPDADPPPAAEPAPVPTPTEPTDDPAKRQAEHRPVDVDDPGPNERLIQDIAATTGLVTLPELVDEILGDVVAEIAQRPASWLSPMAIRHVTLGSNVAPGYARRLVAAVVAHVHAGTDVRVVECLECQATRSRVVGAHWQITKGLVGTDEARAIAKKIGAKSFMDVSFGFEPETGVLQMDFSIVRAEDGVMLWADSFRADETTPMLMRSSFSPQRRKERLRDLEMLLEGRPFYGIHASGGWMLIPYDDPIGGDISGATAGFRIYERFGEDRRWLFGLDVQGFLNLERLIGGVISAGGWWVPFRPDLTNPEFRVGGKTGAFVAGSEGNAAMFQLGAEVLLRYRFGLYGYFIFMTKSQFGAPNSLGGLGYSAGLSFNW